jgi:hypothetical protein
VATAADGLVEFRGVAGDIRVGSKIRGETGAKKDSWEVIDTRNPNQYDLGRTPWLRVRRLGTEEVVAIPPKTVKSPVTFLLLPEELDFAERYGYPPRLPKVLLADAEEVALLVEKLGATEIATRDTETGEIWCPDYEAGALPEGVHWRDRAQAKLDHLRLAHGMDISALEQMDWEPQMLAITQHHGAAHRDNMPGGFPHRHVPETNLHML